MALLDLHDAEQPIDPKLVLAIEAAFRSVSVTPVEFVPVPRAWRHPAGSVSGPKSDRKAQIKIDLAKRDGARCAYCAREFIDLNDATLDHVIPNTVVRHWQPWNLLLACGACNNAKNDQVPLVLLPMMLHLVRQLGELSRWKREMSKPIPTNGYPSKSAAKRAQKAKRRQRQEFYRAVHAMGGPFVRLALEAAPVSAALLAGQDGQS